MVFESIFHCTYPVSSGHIIFKTHPTLPELEASRCDVVRCKDDEQKVDNYSHKSVAHIVFECWSGEELKPFTNIRFKNMNQYDASYDNLEILILHCPIRIAKEKKFMQNTVNQMLIREELFGHKRDMTQYFNELGIHQKYIRQWEKVSPQCRAKQYNNAMV